MANDTFDTLEQELAQYYYNKDYAELSESQQRSIDNQLLIPINDRHPEHPDNK